jgi:hypothetical protein
MSAGGVALGDLAKLAYAAAARIEAVQGVLVAAGHREAADPGEMAAARNYDAIGKLIDFVRSDAMLVARVRELARRRVTAKPAAAANAGGAAR